MKPSLTPRTHFPHHWAGIMTSRIFIIPPSKFPSLAAAAPTQVWLYALSGNNAEAFNIIQADPSVESGPNSTFVFAPDLTEDPTVQVNLDAARTNAFYVVNKMHDISYRYGFTETSFNFQTNNFGLGGKGNDRVLVDVQAQGFNNALFSSARDGLNGILYLFLWTKSTPRRDGALENDIIVHEVDLIILIRVSMLTTYLAVHARYH